MLKAEIQFRLIKQHIYKGKNETYILYSQRVQKKVLEIIRGQMNLFTNTIIQSSNSQKNRNCSLINYFKPFSAFWVAAWPKSFKFKLLCCWLSKST